MNGKQLNHRIVGLLLLFAAILTLFAAVLYDLQIKQGADFYAQSTRKIAKTETVDAARGELVDRYGRLLVSNRTSYNVTLDTSLMGDDPNQTLLALLQLCRDEDVTWSDSLPLTDQSPYLLNDTLGNTFKSFLKDRKWPETINGTELLTTLSDFFKLPEGLSSEEARALVGVRYELYLRAKDLTYVAYTFAQDVDISFITQVKEAGLRGVNIVPTTVRQYHTTYAAHILGRVDLMNGDEWNNIYSALNYPYNASVGKDGVEQAFESYLHGSSGIRAVETSTTGKIISQSWLPDRDGNPQAPLPGDNVMLTLDIELQGVVEQSLADRITQLNSTQTKGAAAVVIDVDDGSVRAMASYPTFDLSTYKEDYVDLSQDPLSPFLNRATQGTYSPGSTYKMVTAIGGLEEGLLHPNSTYYCGGRYTYYADYQPMCWIFRQYGGAHGNETIAEAIRDSCNIFFYDTGRRLGIDGLEKYARLLGLGEPTGIEIYEKVGVTAGPAYTESLGQTWYTGSTLSAAIGQENNQFTPLQLANYVATIANGGTHYEAHLLEEVKSNDYSQTLLDYEPQVINQLEIEGLEQVTYGMYLVTQPGGAAYSYLKDLDVNVAGKTGSSQMGDGAESNALFVCFAPYEDPEIALAIVVERGGSGSTLGNIAADILEYYFSTGNNLDQLPPENTLLR